MHLCGWSLGREPHRNRIGLPLGLCCQLLVSRSHRGMACPFYIQGQALHLRISYVSVMLP